MEGGGGAAPERPKAGFFCDFCRFCIKSLWGGTPPQSLVVFSSQQQTHLGITANVAKALKSLEISESKRRNL